MCWSVGHTHRRTSKVPALNLKDEVSNFSHKLWIAGRRRCVRGRVCSRAVDVARCTFQAPPRRVSRDPHSIRQSGRRRRVGRCRGWMPPCRPGAFYESLPSAPAGARRSAGCRRCALATHDGRTRATASVAAQLRPTPLALLLVVRPAFVALPPPSPFVELLRRGGLPVMQFFNRETPSRRPAARPPRRARLATPLPPHPGTPWQTPVGPHGAMPPRPRARSVWWGSGSVRVGGGREACLIRR